MESLLNDLLWIEEHLPHDILMIPRFGGQAYYLDGNLVLILVERPGRNDEHKGVTYPFDLWKGAIFPIEQKKQSAFFLKYVFLENHPFSKHWLYIPMESENFEEEVTLMLRELSRRNILLGIPAKSDGPPKPKVPTLNGGKKKAKKTRIDKKKENAFFLSMTKSKPTTGK